MDIKAKVDEIVTKIKKDPNLMEEFKKNPVGAIEKLSGVDLPDGATDAVVDGVKAALAGDKIGGVADKIKGLF